MPLEPECIEKHGSGTHLDCNLCSENKSYSIMNLRQLDQLTESFIVQTMQYPEWAPFQSQIWCAVNLIIHEACMNAVEHGILGLDKTAKKRLLEIMEEEYLPMVEDEWGRRNHPVYVSLCLNRERILIGIHDDGPGFDFANIGFSPVMDQELLDFSGRGLVMLNGMGAKLYWNNRGNSVLCSYHRPDLHGKNPPASPEGVDTSKPFS